MNESAQDRRDVLLINPASGDGSGPGGDELAEAAREVGVEPVLLGEGTDLAVLARREAETASAIGMAGGDGSLGCVADAAMAAAIPFVCIPFGTRNHFALDLGLDRRDPIAALRAFVERHELIVDVARVGDRVVMNNLTLGVYAEVVHSEDYRDAKVREGARVTREMLRGEREADHYVITDPDGVRHEAPFALVVANNCYGESMQMSGIGRRARLDQGVLQVSLIDTDSGWDLAALLWSLTAGGGELDHAAFSQWTVTELDIASDTHSIKVGVDGEAVTIPTPVAVRTEPGALRVLLPTQAIRVERRGLFRAVAGALSPDG
jgi:diacylglycerol kinase family enzyme